jgi:DNA repair photolyase
MPDRGDRAQRGRAATGNPANRFHAMHSEAVDDGWSREHEPPRLDTTLAVDSCRTVITRNSSPDVPFDRSINPYRGCEHGCIYCFARPTHAWLDLSPGLDFETRLFYRPDAAALLREELSHPAYRCAPVAIGANTDAYQPVERRLGLTREILEVMVETSHPCVIITKSSLVERDMDLLAALAEKGLVQVMVSLTTLDRQLARCMEPRAASPQRRLGIIRRLADKGIPAGVLAAPVVPVLTDPELESLLKSAREAGAQSAGYILLRLPHEVKTLFRDWLDVNYPQRAAHVMNAVRETRGGRENDPRFGARQTGSGVLADMIASRFRLAVKRLQFPGPGGLDCRAFRSPAALRQPDLFGGMAG